MTVASLPAALLPNDFCSPRAGDVHRHYNNDAAVEGELNVNSVSRRLP